MDDLRLIRFIQNDVTVEEARQVLHWIEQSEANRSYFAQLQALYAASYISTGDSMNKKAIADIMNRIQKDKKVVSLYRYYAAAACLIVIIIAGLVVWNIPEKQLNYEAAIQKISQGKDITLMIGGGEEIQLADSMANIMYGNKQIVINDTTRIVNQKSNAPNLIRVPYGKRSKLILSDGTVVFLNAGSILVYPSDFSDNLREVYLDGEAYFDVAKDEKRTFVVKTLYRSVEVLGTKFNLSVDRSLESFEAVLVSGSVEIKGGERVEMLAPNQYYGYSFRTNTEEIKSVDVLCYTSWIEGELRFRKEYLRKAIRKLEKIYNIRIELSDEKYLEYQVSGRLNLRDSAEETVRTLMSTIVPELLSNERNMYRIKYNYLLNN